MQDTTAKVSTQYSSGEEKFPGVEHVQVVRSTNSASQIVTNEDWLRASKSAEWTGKGKLSLLHSQQFSSRR